MRSMRVSRQLISLVTRASGTRRGCVATSMVVSSAPTPEALEADGISKDFFRDLLDLAVTFPAH